MFGKLVVSGPGQGRLIRVAVVGLVAISVSVGLVACGDSGASKEEIAQAEKRGRRYRMEQERKRKIEKELRELRRQQKRLGKAKPSPPSTVVVESGSSGSSSGTSSCGGGLSVGPATTCAFAENVRSEYEYEIGSGSGTVYAYSAANKETYEMFCTAAPHECSGAISATVYFP